MPTVIILFFVVVVVVAFFFGGGGVKCENRSFKFEKASSNVTLKQFCDIAKSNMTVIFPYQKKPNKSSNVNLQHHI